MGACRPSKSPTSSLIRCRLISSSPGWFSESDLDPTRFFARGPSNAPLGHGDGLARPTGRMIRNARVVTVGSVATPITHVGPSHQ